MKNHNSDAKQIADETSACAAFLPLPQVSPQVLLAVEEDLITSVLLFLFHSELVIRQSCSPPHCCCSERAKNGQRTVHCRKSLKCCLSCAQSLYSFETFFLLLKFVKNIQIYLLICILRCKKVKSDSPPCFIIRWCCVSVSKQ